MSQEQPGGFVGRAISLASAVATRRPVWVVTVAVLIAALGGYIYAQHLKLVNDRGQMTDPELEFNQNYRNYIAQFGDDSKYLMLVVKADREGPASEADRQAMKSIAKGWSERLRASPKLYPRVIERIELDQMGPMALLYLPFDEQEKITQAAAKQLPTLEAWAGNPSLGNLVAQLQSGLEGMEPEQEQGEQGKNAQAMLGGIKTLFEWMNQGLSQDAPAKIEVDLQAQIKAQMARSGRDPDGFFFKDDGRLLLVLAPVTPDSSQRNRYKVPLELAHDALEAALEGAPDGIEAGLAGWPAMEHEEMETIQRDFARGTIITIVLVSLLFMLGFRSLVRPALAAVCLGISIGATFLFAYLVVGYLNVLAMIFTVILVALGIDFAIHFVTHYERAMAEGHSPADAIAETFKHVGGAIWMGGLTTACAFLTATLTDFVGLKELGTIAGGGLVLCLLCIFVVYPAMLLLLDTRAPGLADKLRVGKAQKNGSPRRSPLLRTQGGGAVAVLVVALGVSAAGYATGQYGFDTNLLNLLPGQGEARRWQDELLRTEDQAAFAISTAADPQTLAKRQKAFEDSKVVSRTESVLPTRLDERAALQKPLCDPLSSLKVAAPTPTSKSDLRRGLFKLRQTLRAYRQADPRADKALEPVQTSLEAAFKTLGGLEEEVAARRMAVMEGQLKGFTQAQLTQGKMLLCPPQWSIEVAPEPLVRRFVGKDGTLALVAYPEGNAWEPERLEGFVQGVREVDPGVFGGLVNYYENVLSMRGSFLQSALYALVAIVLMLLVWSRSLKVTVLASLPLVTGVGTLLGLMAWLPLSIMWNPANFFALPILIGIGVDSGIHLVEGWRSEETLSGAARAVLLSTLTTMIGFGVLATSAHRGTRSLGLILLVGISAILLTSLTVLPAALSLFGQSLRQPNAAEDE